MIVLDTLRADHLSSYGYPRPTSPHIDSFARSATRYTRAMASAPWTLPTHASLMTGLPPFAHGAHAFENNTGRDNARPLDPSYLTLAEVLREQGFSTAGFVANFTLRDGYGIEQGFDTYVVERGYADAVNDLVFAWLDEQRANASPFFLFLNYMDTHRIYNTSPRPGFIERPLQPWEHRALDELCKATMPMNRSNSAELAAPVIEQYDTAIANLDAEIGRLLERLESLGLLENSVVVITSDHGEYFGEHSLCEHSKDVYQEAVAVPLIIRAPNQRDGAVVDTPVASYDVPRLIASRLPAPLADEVGRSLPLGSGGEPVISEIYYSRPKDYYNREWGWRFKRVRTAVFDWPYKYIHSSDGQHELYHLENDPSESNNLIEGESETAERLATRLSRYRSTLVKPANRPRELPTLSEQDVERMKALGYL